MKNVDLGGAKIDGSLDLSGALVEDTIILIFAHHSMKF